MHDCTCLQCSVPAVQRARPSDVRGPLTTLCTTAHACSAACLQCSVRGPLTHCPCSHVKFPADPAATLRPATDVLNNIDISPRLNEGWFTPSTDMSWPGTSKEGYGWYARVALDVPGPGPVLLEYADQEAPAEVVALFSGDGTRAIAIGGLPAADSLISAVI
jgi:hypothetical protein